MSRILFKLSLPCVFVFTIAILLISGNASSGDAEVRALLLPPTDCRVPCFMGIRLGVTTLDAGLHQLDTSPLIQSISPVLSEPDSPVPSGLYNVEFLQISAPMRAAQVQFLTTAGSGVIEGIDLMDTGIQLRDILLTFGQPTSLILSGMPHLGLVTYTAFYSQYQMYVQMNFAACVPEAGTFWDTQQNLLIGTETARKYAEERSYYPSDADQNDEGWLTQIKDMKSTICT